MKANNQDTNDERFDAAAAGVQATGNVVGQSHEPGKTRILVVDDDAVVEGMIRESFGNQYEVQASVSCVDFVYVLDSFRPHLIILDIGLPWINGIDLCRDLRQSSRYKRIPVLFLSAMTSPDDVAAGLKAGANGYMTKPFCVNELKKTVAQLLTQLGT
jgi:DNA-binding response OmpR family regulator